VTLAGLVSFDFFPHSLFKENDRVDVGGVSYAVHCFLLFFAQRDDGECVLAGSHVSLYCWRVAVSKACPPVELGICCCGDAWGVQGWDASWNYEFGFFLKDYW